MRASAGLEAARAASGGGSRGHVLERRRSIGDQSLPRARRVHIVVSLSSHAFVPFIECARTSRLKRRERSSFSLR